MLCNPDILDTMYVVKIKYEDTLRRIVLEDCFTYESLFKIVSERFELPATFCGVLRYEDPDGDLISVSTDDEVEEALRLCGDGKTLKMTLSATQGAAPTAFAAPQDDAAVGKAWAGALSNVFDEKEAAAAAQVSADVCSPSASRTSMSSASGDFEMVDESDSRPASVRSGVAAVEEEAAARHEPPEEEDEALQAALKASAEEEASRLAAEEQASRLAAQEAEIARIEEEAARMQAAEAEAARVAVEAAEAARVEAEVAEVARVAAELKKATEEDAARLAAEEAARVAAEAEEEDARLSARVAAEAERIAAEEEAARVAAEESARKAAEEQAALAAAEEASRRAAQELAAQIAAEEEAAAAKAAEEEENKARLEIAFAAAEEDALRRADELFNMGCTVDQIRSLYGESILMQLRLVPRMSDVHTEMPIVPEPVVNWEAAKAVAEQPEAERFPSQEQSAAVDEVGDLAARLTAFYFEHNPGMLDTVADVSRKFAGREQELNDALLRKYKCDLNSMVAEQASAVALQEADDSAAARRMVEEEEFADAQSEVVAEEEKVEEEEPMSQEVREAIANFESMGFTDRATNLALLVKHDNNVEAALNELLG